MLKLIVITLGLAVAAAPAHAIIDGTPFDVERSGFVSLQTASSTCGAVALAPDLLLGSARCFDGTVLQHPELLGWFMGTQDSDGNPAREVVLDRAGNFALIRLTTPLVGVPSRALYHGQVSDLHDVRCFAFGPRGWEIFPTGATPSYADYTVSGPAENLALAGKLLTAFDMGGVCIAGNGEVAAIVKSSSEVVSTTLARAFVTEARTTFELVSAATNLCIGNVPNSSNLWQFPCAAGGSYDRVNQQWMIRRIGRDGRFQLRSIRFPGLCLGSAGASTAEGAAVVVSACAPVILDPFPTRLPTEYRPEQLWDISVAAGDTVRLANVAASKCLDLASTSLGAGLVQTTCSASSTTQRFLVDADRFPAGSHRLAAYADTGQCMDVSFGVGTWGSAIGGWYCDGQEKQRFDLTSAEGTPLQLVQRLWPGNITCLAVPGGSGAPGVGVIQWPCGPWLDHRWLFRWTPGLYGFRVRPAHATTMCLTRPAGPPSSQLVQAPCEAGLPGAAYDAQRWVVE